VTNLTPEQMIEKILQSLRRTGERFAKPRRKKTTRAAKNVRTTHRASAKAHATLSRKRKG
jgi:hypothetical protein